MRSRLILLLLIIGVLTTAALSLNTSAANIQQHNVKTLTDLTETGIIVDVDNEGHIDLYVGVVGNAVIDVPYINFRSSDTYYSSILSIGFYLVRGSDEYTQIIIETNGDTTSDSGVNTYVNSIKDSILNALDLTMSEENHLTSYDGAVTHYLWEYTLTDTESKIYSSIQNFAENVVSNPINSLLNLNGHLNFTDFSFGLTRGSSEDNFALIYVLEAEIWGYFSGEGTHTFSLKEILGVESLPTGTDYTVYIFLPTEATIDETTINTGDAEHYVTGNQLVVIVTTSTSISDISFNFTYTFETPTSGGGSDDTSSGSTGGTEETEDNRTSTGTTSESFLSSSSMLYIGGAIAVIAVVGVIARVFLRGRY